MKAHDTKSDSPVSVDTVTSVILYLHHDGNYNWAVQYFLRQQTLYKVNAFERA